MNTPRIGLFIGKFLPLHQGHIWSITAASTMVEHLYVLGSWASGNATEINGKHIDEATLNCWLHKGLSHIPNVSACTLNETDLPPAPLGWEPWSALVKYVLNKEFNIRQQGESWYHDDYMINLNIFTGERSYVPYYERYFGHFRMQVLDPQRKMVGVTGTQIRSDLNKYWDYISPPAQETLADVRTR